MFRFSYVFFCLADNSDFQSLHRSMHFVFPKDMPPLHAPLEHRCLAICGDYVSIASDFRSRIQSRPWMPIHEHMMKVRSDGVRYKRDGRLVPWAADLVFIDLPFGGFLHSTPSQPTWDKFTDEHVRSGIHLTHSTLADSGWLVVFGSIAGKKRAIFF